MLRKSVSRQRRPLKLPPMLRLMLKRNVLRLRRLKEPAKKPRLRQRRKGAKPTRLQLLLLRKLKRPGRPKRLLRVLPQATKRRRC